MSSRDPHHDYEGLSRRGVLGAGSLLAATALLPGQPATAGPARGGPTAPVPPNAGGPKIPAAGYLVRELGDNLFWLTDGQYQMMFLVTGEGVLAVDAPPTLGNNILRAVRKVTRKKVTHAVYSHAHADHVGAMVLYEGATLWSHTAVARSLKVAKDPNRPVPKRAHTFRRSQELRLGGQRLRLDYRGPNHSPGNLFVYAPRQRVLMLVDVIFPGWVPFAYLAVSQNIPGWITAHQKALDYPFKTLIGGHLTRLGTRDDVRTQQAYIDDLRSRAEYELTHVDFDAILENVDAKNPWAVFQAYLDAVATQTAKYIEPRWVKRLGGADVFTNENAWTMAESLRLDYGKMDPFGIHP